MCCYYITTTLHNNKKNILCDLLHWFLCYKAKESFIVQIPLIYNRLYEVFSAACETVQKCTITIRMLTKTERSCWQPAPDPGDRAPAASYQ